MKKLFITGTDTGVGKTVTSGLIAKSLGKSSRVAYIKPVQTGSDNDACLVRKISPNLVSLPQSLEMPYHFRLPASPHLASREESIIISPKKILQAISEIEQSYDIDYLLIEGAGGVLVPLTENYFMIDLIKDIGCPCLIVARCGLGTLNHSLLTHTLISDRKIKCLGLVLSQMPSQQDIILKENIAFLKRRVEKTFVISSLTNYSSSRVTICNELLNIINVG